VVNIGMANSTSPMAEESTAVMATPHDDDSASMLQCCEMGEVQPAITRLEPELAGDTASGQGVMTDD
jgi:hypothetical protein